MSDVNLFREGSIADSNLLKESRSERTSSVREFGRRRSFVSIAESAKEDIPDISQLQSGALSPTGLQRPQPRLSVEDLLVGNRGRSIRGRNFASARSSSQRPTERSANPISVLDLANTDLHVLKKSFLAHAKAISTAELKDINQMSINVLREMRLADRAQLRRQQLLGHGVSPSRGRVSEVFDGDLFSDTTVSTNSTMEGSTSGIDTGNLMESGSQRPRIMSVWIYELLVRSRLDELGKRKGGTAPNLPPTSGILGIFPGGIKGAVDMLRSSPVPTQVSGFDVCDEMYDRMRATDTNTLHKQEDVGFENIELPLPVFVYVFSRALFRRFYMNRFPLEVFTDSDESWMTSELTKQRAKSPEGPTPLGNSPTRRRKRNKFNYISGNSSFMDDCFATGDGILQEVTSLMDSCRLSVLNFFELLDTEQAGMMSWSTFTDALTEQVEVQHRVMTDKENYEEFAHTDARVFDKYVVHPFPAVLQRLGYVGVVTELRRSGSAVIIEGRQDFAVCDSMYSGFIKQKLLVRTDDALFSHLKGSTDPWDAERWDAMAEGFSTKPYEKLVSTKFQRFEDGRRRDERAAATGRCDSDSEMNGSGGVEASSRVDSQRKKPSIVSALQIRDVEPDLPPVVVTLHNDLLLRFFRMDVHLWVLPETAALGSSETLTAMDWCGTVGEGDAALRGMLFLSLRGGFICRVDLVAILRRIVGASYGASDFLSTGAAAAATLNERIDAFVLQKIAVHKDVITALSLNSHGILLSAGLDGKVVLSRAVTLTPVRTFRADPTAGIRFACLTPLRNTIVTLTTANRLSLWGNTAQSTPIDLYDPFGPHYFPITGVRVDEDMDQVISLDSSGFVKIWSLRQSLPSTSFYAVAAQCFCAFRQMYSTKKSEVVQQQNGYRLFDEDEKEGRRPRVSAAVGLAADTSSGSTAGRCAALKHATFASIEMASKAVQLHPAKYMAYDWAAKRFFVSGVRNNVLCVFTGGSTALTAHDEPLCHMAVCERNRWLISMSEADCRVWRFRTGVMTLGIKVGSAEFITAHVSPSFPPPSASGRVEESVNKMNRGFGRLALDACKKPKCTLREVMRSVNMATHRRRIQERESFTGLLMKSNASNGNKSVNKGEGEVLKESYASGSPATDRHGTNESVNSENAHLKEAAEKDSVVEDAADAQGVEFKILCSHVDLNERFIFYALRGGDIRMHRTDSGRLVKTFMTVQPSRDIILAAVYESRHLLQSKQLTGERSGSVVSEEGCGNPLSRRGSFTKTVLGGVEILHDVATVLQRLLRSDDRTALCTGADRVSIHREAVGLMTPHYAQELGVAYADGIIRFYSLIGNAVHAQRIVIPEFLVARAVTCLFLARQATPGRPLSTPFQIEHQAQRQQESHNAGKHQHGQNTAATVRTPSLEADAVSLVTVSYLLNLLCLVQVNGRISLLDMSNQTGAVTQEFFISGELTSVTFLGAYPCLVVADAQGRVSFFLVKGSSLLSFMEDFYKSVLVHHRNMREQPSYAAHYEQLLDTLVTDSVRKGSRSTGRGLSAMHGSKAGRADVNSTQTCFRMWFFRTAGVPDTMHFDPVHCALYIGTRQGFVSSYLVRNLVIAFDLNPSVGIKTRTSALSKTSANIGALWQQQQKEANERRVSNILLTFFDITQERMMHYMRKVHISNLRLSERHRMTPDSRPTSSRFGVVSWYREMPNEQCPHQHRSARLNASLGSSPTRVSKGSLVYVFENFRPLFYPTQSRSNRAAAPHLIDLHTATLTDLLVATAVLHHALLLMARRRTGILPANMEGGFSTATLNADELSHLRQCIVEEVRYRNEQRREDYISHANVNTAARMFSENSTPSDNRRESNGSKSDTLPSEGPCFQHIPEVECEISEIGVNLNEYPSSITDDWVELLFRRHVLQAASNSPLALLTPNGAIERARRERYERAKLLLIQANLDRSEKSIPASFRSLSFGAGASPVTTVSVDWDAFLEGGSPDVVSDVLKNRLSKAQQDEEAMNEIIEGDAVRSIVTRRNGFVFIGCANGSISMWSPFVGARLEHMSPRAPLEESIYRVGESIKLQFVKKVERFAHEKQRQAFTSRGYSKEHHANLMRNLYVGYKVATMKNEATRVQEQERRNTIEPSTILRGPPSQQHSESCGNNLQDGRLSFKLSTTGPFGPPAQRGRRGTPRDSRSLVDGTGLEYFNRSLSLQEPLADRTVRRRLVDGERDLLIAVLGLEPGSLSQKGISVEDMYFLPLQMSVLAELEKFKVPAYEAAVDLATNRLIRELRSIGYGDGDPGAVADAPLSNADRLISDDDRVDDEARSTLAADALWNSNPGASISAYGKTHADNDGDDAIDDAVRFYLHTHVRHIASFFVDQHYRRFAHECYVASAVSARSSEASPNVCRSHTGASSASSPSTVAPDASPPAVLSPNFATWMPPESTALPSHARAGTEPGSGFFTLSTTPRRDRQLLGCHALDLVRLAGAARWSSPVEPLRAPGAGVEPGLAAQTAWLHEPVLLAPPAAAEEERVDEEELGQLHRDDSNCNVSNNSMSTNTASTATATGTDHGKKRFAFFVTQPIIQMRRPTAAGLAAALMVNETSDVSLSESAMADPPMEWSLESKKHTHRARLAVTGSADPAAKWLPGIYSSRTTPQGYSRTQRPVSQKEPVKRDELRCAESLRMQGGGQRE